jgi:acetyl esterase/lipase
VAPQLLKGTSNEHSSLLTEVAGIRCPVMMISGQNDPNAPYQVMDLYMAKVRAAGHETETYRPDNGPHGFYFGLPKAIPETAESSCRAVAFIKKHFAAVAN